MLTDVVEAWVNGTIPGSRSESAAKQGRLYIPEPEMFYPQVSTQAPSSRQHTRHHGLKSVPGRLLRRRHFQFDDGNTRIRETCEVGKCFECKQKDAAVREFFS